MLYGRRLAIGDGDYFLDLPYATPTQRFQAKMIKMIIKFLMTLINNYTILDSLHKWHRCPSNSTQFIMAKDVPTGQKLLSLILINKQLIKCHK